MINPKCNICNRELEVPGGILISPPVLILNPSTTPISVTHKYHICSQCWRNTIEDLVVPEIVSDER